MDWNYYNTFITVAPDCPVQFGTMPPAKKDGMSKHGIEYDLIAEHPYEYTQEELLFQVHIRHKAIPADELKLCDAELRQEFFNKPKACLGASMLSKKFGWGIHFNAEGKLALVPMESPEYNRLLENGDGTLQIVSAMRNKSKNR
ncbi:DUF6157 family protein [Paenibacillus sp. ACRRX]|uniref:DUF6157 family protein n=1 Tax=Paenibacillus sp. ACRRX TaxID=2918206 RepID=UPI001EF45326|nr:DUF6157 family protein [Paenibacillus sp. ACRRX]MCG7409965.1 DUF6157 family protein [Paenibacillus sp. ACRRX]